MWATDHKRERNFAFDTDLIGPYGMCSDPQPYLWIGNDLAPANMRESFKEAVEHIRYNN